VELIDFVATLAQQSLDSLLRGNGGKPPCLDSQSLDAGAKAEDMGFVAKVDSGIDLIMLAADFVHISVAAHIFYKIVTHFVWCIAITNSLFPGSSLRDCNTYIKK